MTRSIPVLALLAALASCASAERAAPAASPPRPEALAAPEAPPPGVVDGVTAHRLVAAGVRVVDVRTPAEFQSGHVPGAVNIPYDQLPQRRHELGAPSTPVLLYCQSGRRSGIAAADLRQAGFTRVYDLRTYASWVATEPASDR